METIYYSIRINTNDNTTIRNINDILNIQSSSEDTWIYELIQGDDGYINFIEIFTNILDNNITPLEKIGVRKSDISIWMLCNYEDQCNLEFTPKQIIQLSRVGISLCISCWDNNSTELKEDD